jgi:hypothetical protein
VCGLAARHIACQVLQGSAHSASRTRHHVLTTSLVRGSQAVEYQYVWMLQMGEECDLVLELAHGHSVVQLFDSHLAVRDVAQSTVGCGR